MTRILHEPVMVNQVVSYLLAHRREVIVDCTAGDGGHSEAVLQETNSTFVIAIDIDSEAVAVAKERLQRRYPGRVLVMKGDYRELQKTLAVLGVPRVDGILLDLGVSSRQVDVPQRGFTYWGRAPLDMRMDRDSQVTARDILMTYSEGELRRIIREYGEERFAARIARGIVQRRDADQLETAEDLVEVVKKAIPVQYRQNDIHPARKTFQALRIATNDEISRLRASIERFFSHLRPGGALVVLSYHSLEDRIVKTVFKQLEESGDGRRLTRKPEVPSEAEVRANPRARSAKLRALEKVHRVRRGPK
ncbi:MAG: 16S rRNA (cytosine(1402)-N(4))-methyltransferase RsmH [Bacillota bacterium]|jgi:16S rRNA (cytosine1402-N4)-methyltransferase